MRLIMLAALVLTALATRALEVRAAMAASASAPAQEAALLWDMQGEGRFDESNKAYAMEGDTVTVNLARPGEMCPTGLGHLASGRQSVKRLVLQFVCLKSGTYYVHIQWNGGGSGVEQFEVLVDGRAAAKSARVDAQQQPYEYVNECVEVELAAGEHQISLVHLSGDGLRFATLALSSSRTPPLPVRMDLELPTLAAYEGAIGEKGSLLDSGQVRLLAPRSRQAEAAIIHGYLVKAYAELHRITGLDTRYRLVVYHFPENHPRFTGGTSNCTIRYGYKNLDLASQPEWMRHHVPHVSGCIEEMAHNFVDAAGVQFGWEMVGWSLGVEATTAVADNPIFAQQVRQTRAGQAQTFARYIQQGRIFPKDLPANQCDRIHAHLLWLCRQRYGAAFWPDFFAEVRKHRKEFALAEAMSSGDVRDIRYRLSVECFSALKGLNFRALLKQYGISERTDVKSLRPEDPGWDRRFIPAAER